MEGLEGDSLRSVLSHVSRGPQTRFAGSSLGFGPANPVHQYLGYRQRWRAPHGRWAHFLLPFTLISPFSSFKLVLLIYEVNYFTLSQSKNQHFPNSEELLGPVDSLRPLLPSCPGPALLQPLPTPPPLNVASKSVLEVPRQHFMIILTFQISSGVCDELIFFLFLRGLSQFKTVCTISRAHFSLVDTVSMVKT